jgi:hypothetical protein
VRNTKQTKSRKKWKRCNTKKGVKLITGPILGILVMLYVCNLNGSYPVIVDGEPIVEENNNTSTDTLVAGISKVMVEYMNEPVVSTISNAGITRVMMSYCTDEVESVTIEDNEDVVTKASAPEYYEDTTLLEPSIQSEDNSIDEDTEEVVEEKSPKDEITEIEESIEEDIIEEEVKNENEFEETRWEEKYVPEGYGSVHPYMGWSMITSKGTKQYTLRKEVEDYDEDGFGKVKDRYAVAVKPYYGDIGDLIDVVQTDGTIIKCIIVDHKGNENKSDDGWLAAYVHYNNDIVEFVVNKSSWYGTSKSVNKYHPEWKHNISVIYNVGNYWDQTND